MIYDSVLIRDTKMARGAQPKPKLVQLLWAGVELVPSGPNLKIKHKIPKIEKEIFL